MRRPSGTIGRCTVPIAFHHIHLYVPEDAVTEAKAWYVRMFGGVPGKRSNYDAVDLPGINVNISSAPKATVPTKGRMLDHIGFEVAESRGVLQEARIDGCDSSTCRMRRTPAAWRARR